MMTNTNNLTTRNKILIAILSLVGLVFTGLLFALTSRPDLDLNKDTLNQENVKEAHSQAEVEINLNPFQIETKPGQTFSISILYENLSQSIVSSDLILDYNPKSVEFVGISDLNDNYINPRALNQNGRLILSFVQKQRITPTNKLKMAKLEFKAIASGETIIMPIINNKARSSMVIGQNQDNLLSSVNQIQVKIK